MYLGAMGASGVRRGRAWSPKGSLLDEMRASSQIFLRKAFGFQIWFWFLDRNLTCPGDDGRRSTLEG